MDVREERSTEDRADGSDVPVTDLVVRETAEALGVSPLDLPPLHDAIDPEALDGIFDPYWADSPSVEGHLVFGYAGCRVAVHGDGSVLVDRNTPDSGRPEPVS